MGRTLCYVDADKKLIHGAYLLLIGFEGKDVPPSQYTRVTRALRPNQLIRARGGRG